MASLPLGQLLARNHRPLFSYRRAMAQQEKGGTDWCVVTNVVKWSNGQVKKHVYESRLPSRERAKSLARILNLATDLK